MALLVAKCAECGFDNPRRWVTCARCGQLLGPNANQSVTQRLNTVISELPLSDDITVADLMDEHEYDYDVDDDGGSAAADSETADNETTERFASVRPDNGDARPLIGREVALHALRRNLDLAFSQRRVTLTFLHGEAGMGRTRLLEIASEIGARQWLNTRVVYAGCRSSDGGPYAPFSRLLLERFGVTPASSPSQVRAEMLSTVARALESADDYEVRAVTHLLGHMAGVPFPASAIVAAVADSPAELLDRTADALSRFIEGDSRMRPMLLLLDDMQRAEHEAFVVLARLVSADRPLAIVVAGDASITAQIALLAQLVPTETALLRPLTEPEVKHLVRALVPEVTATDEVMQALWRRSQGNPSTVRELTRALEPANTDAIEIDEDSLELDTASDRLPALPASDVLQMRLAALPPFERAVMQWACVIGELFWDGALLALARSEQDSNDPMPAIDPILRWTQAHDEARIQEALLSLERKNLIVGLVESAPAGLREYTFAIPNTRSFMYTDIDEDTRRQRHAVVAGWMTLSEQLPREGLAAALAQHHERAGHRAQAAQAFLAAAHAERARLRTTMAVRYAQKTLALAEPYDPVTRLAALQEIGSLLTTLGYYDPAVDAYGELVELAWRIGARSVGGAALQGLARIHRYRGQHDSAHEYLQRALLLFYAAEDVRGVAAIFDDMAQVHRALGELDPALTAAHRALHECRAAHDVRREAMALTTLGLIELDRGNLAAARGHFDAAQRARAGDDTDPESALQTEIALGKLAHHEAQYARASKRYNFALDRARTMNDRRLQYLLLNHLAEVQLALCSYERALELLTKAHELASELRDQKALTEIQQNLALVALFRNEPTAERQLTVALQSAREHGTREAIAAAHRGIARMRARALTDGAQPETTENAERSFREAVRIFEESGNLREAACTRAELGFYLVERGAGARARAALGEAYAALKPLSLPALERVTETLEQLGS